MPSYTGSGTITSGHARALINLPNKTAQLSILKKILDKNLSVRKVEQLVKEFYATPKTETGKKSFTILPKTASANLNDVEDKLRKIFGTKVSCKQKKNGSGEIVIEYYSSTELERLFELFEIIDKNYN
jgi:ParB family chromosome partitioning protein